MQQSPKDSLVFFQAHKCYLSLPQLRKHTPVVKKPLVNSTNHNKKTWNQMKEWIDKNIVLKLHIAVVESTTTSLDFEVVSINIYIIVDMILNSSPWHSLIYFLKSIDNKFWKMLSLPASTTYCSSLRYY